VDIIEFRRFFGGSEVSIHALMYSIYVNILQELFTYQQEILAQSRQRQSAAPMNASSISGIFM